MTWLAKRRQKRHEFHENNLLALPPEEQRIAGWNELIAFTAFNYEILNRWIKLHDFPKPGFHYTKKEGTWRRSAIWDKRQVETWMETRPK